jgi:hypothetical protein
VGWLSSFFAVVGGRAGSDGTTHHRRCDFEMHYSTATDPREAGRVMLTSKKEDDPEIRHETRIICKPASKRSVASLQQSLS